MRILVTGGAGYIGSHTLVSLLSKENEICMVDNYANSTPIALDRVRRLTNHDFEQHELDIGDGPLIIPLMIFAEIAGVGSQKTQKVINKT